MHYVMHHAMHYVIHYVMHHGACTRRSPCLGRWRAEGWHGTGTGTCMCTRRAHAVHTHCPRRAHTVHTPCARHAHTTHTQCTHNAHTHIQHALRTQYTRHSLSHTQHALRTQYTRHSHAVHTQHALRTGMAARSTRASKVAATTTITAPAHMDAHTGCPYRCRAALACADGGATAQLAMAA